MGGAAVPWGFRTMVATTLSAGGLAVVHYNTDDPSGVQADTVTFALLRPIGSDNSTQNAIREMVLQAYAEHEAQAAVAS